MARVSRRDMYDNITSPSLPPAIRELLDRVEDTRPLDMYMYFENGRQMLHVSHRDGSMEDIYLGDILDRCDGGYLINYRDDLAVGPRLRTPSPPPHWLSKTSCSSPLPRARCSYYEPRMKYPLESTTLLLPKQKCTSELSPTVIPRPTLSKRYVLDALDLPGLDYPRGYASRLEVPGILDDSLLRKPFRRSIETPLLDYDGYGERYQRYLPPAVRYYDDAYLPDYSLYRPTTRYYY